MKRQPNRYLGMWSIPIFEEKMFQGLHKLRKLDSQVKKNAEGGGSVKFYPLNDTCGAERNPFNAKDAGAQSRRVAESQKEQR